jgi:hypothetical protein
LPLTYRPCRGAKAGALGRGPGLGEAAVAILRCMCAQCMATAATAAAAATGGRAWLAARSPRWLTPGRLRALTAAMIAAAVVAAGVASG